MKTYRFLALLILSASLAVEVTAGEGKTSKYVILADNPRQTILHFGASDAWSMQRLGTWDEQCQKQVADWLFSTRCDGQGQPMGIGLSLWRFNLGAGSSHQGNQSQISRGTRTECLMNADGTWDWSRQAGQRKFLRLARERGVPYFLAFLNSPPVYFTQNGLATNTGRGGTLNLREDCYDSFAQYMAQALKGIEQHDSVHFDYLSPVNEPDAHWNWQGPKQEGTPATNREIARVARAAAEALQREGMTTQGTVDESSDLRCLLATHQTSWEQGYGIRTFFSPDSTQTYLGDTPGVQRVILGHSYWTNTPVDYMKKIRCQLRDTMAHYGAAFWQSEVCIMQNDEEIGGGGGYDFTMKTALYVARIIHHDLRYAEAQSWSWWRACGGDYKDGLLRMYDRERSVKDSKLLWAFGNYSLFVRPGAVRYEMRGEEDPYGIMATAYLNTDGQWVVVAINYSNNEQEFDLSVSDRKRHQWRLYRTSDADGENLKPVGDTTGKTVLPPRCVTTFVGF